VAPLTAAPLPEDSTGKARTLDSWKPLRQGAAIPVSRHRSRHGLHEVQGTSLIAPGGGGGETEIDTEIALRRPG